MEEAGAGTPPRAIASDPPKKTPPKKTDKAKKTAALPTP